MDDDQQFCLRWNNHQSTLISVFDTLLENGTLVDCTLAAEGKFLKAHKVVLSACSPYFATLLQEQYDKHPIFILKDVKYQELRAMMDYMYRGEVNISQDQLAALLKAAESLQIKGLSDNRSGAPRTEHHRGINVPATATSGGSGKLTGGYTLEQTKRARIGPSSMDSQDLSGSREGSSSPSRRRRKVRRRSIENTMAEVHDNSNSSQIQGNQSSLLQQSNANLTSVGGIAAAASAMASQIQVAGTALATGAAGVTPLGANQGTTQQLTTSVTKKTDSVKGTSDAMNTDNVQAGTAAGADEQDMEHVESHKQNHKHKSSGAGVGKDGEMIIKPKNEYDDDGNEETVEDLTLDEEDMGMDDLDHNAGTSQGGEGSSQGYAAWQHDRSQDELLLATQEAQQRDPQGFLPPSSSNSGIQNFTTCPSNAIIINNNNSSSNNNNNNNNHQQFHHQLQEQSSLSNNTIVNTLANRIHHHNQQQQQQTSSSSHNPHHHHHHHHHSLNFDNLMLNEESYTCPQCYRTYRRHGTLRRHLRQECGKGKSMVCSVCGHRTKRADHLRQHVRKKHPEIAMRSLFRRPGNQLHNNGGATSSNSNVATATSSSTESRNRDAVTVASTIMQHQLQDSPVGAVAAAVALNLKNAFNNSGVMIGGRGLTQIEEIDDNEIVDLDDIGDDDDDPTDNNDLLCDSNNDDNDCGAGGEAIANFGLTTSSPPPPHAGYYQQQLHQQALQQLHMQQKYHQQQQQQQKQHQHQQFQSVAISATIGHGINSAPGSDSVMAGTSAIVNPEKVNEIVTTTIGEEDNVKLPSGAGIGASNQTEVPF